MSAADGGGAGNAAAWAAVYLAHRRALTAYALALTGNADDAADLIQDVLVSLLTRSQECRSPRAFLLGCLRNRAADLRRRAAARPGRPAHEAAVIDPVFLDSDADNLAAHEIVMRVQAALRAAPATQREVIVLKIWGELTFAEIAALLARPLGSVTSDYARGLAALRSVLTAEEAHAGET